MWVLTWYSVGKGLWGACSCSSILLFFHLQVLLLPWGKDSPECEISFIRLLVEYLQAQHDVRRLDHSDGEAIVEFLVIPFALLHNLLWFVLIIVYLNKKLCIYIGYDNNWPALWWFIDLHLPQGHWLHIKRKIFVIRQNTLDNCWEKSTINTLHCQNIQLLMNKAFRCWRNHILPSIHTDFTFLHIFQLELLLRLCALKEQKKMKNVEMFKNLLKTWIDFGANCHSLGTSDNSDKIFMWFTDKVVLQS